MLAICKYVSFSSKYSINKIHKKRKIDRRRGRTCNLLIRSQAPFHWASRPYCVLRALIDHIDYTQTYACRSIIINAHPPTGMALVQNRLDHLTRTPARLHHPPSPSAVYHSCLESSSLPAILLPEQPFELVYAPLDFLGPVLLAILFLASFAYPRQLAQRSLFTSTSNWRPLSPNTLGIVNAIIYRSLL